MGCSQRPSGLQEPSGLEMNCCQLTHISLAWMSIRRRSGKLIQKAGSVSGHLWAIYSAECVCRLRGGFVDRPLPMHAAARLSQNCESRARNEHGPWHKFQWARWKQAYFFARLLGTAPLRPQRRPPRPDGFDYLQLPAEGR